VSLSPAK